MIQKINNKSARSYQARSFRQPPKIGSAMPQMASVVDVLYYDFVLSKLLTLYTEHAPNEATKPYLQIVTILFRQFRDSDTRLDTQAYLKGMCIKIYQFMRCSEANQRTCAEKLFAYFLILSTDCVQTECLNFIKIRNLTFICYAYAYRDDTALHKDYICSIRGTFDYTKLLEMEGLGGSSFEAAILDSLKGIAFDKPALQKFIRTKIKKAQTKKGREKKKVEIFGNDAGEKVAWE